MDATDELKQVRALLKNERAERLKLLADLEAARDRERLLRSENNRLKQRLLDLGESEHKTHGRGYGQCNAAARAQMKTLHNAGQTYSSIGRRLGFSVATVSLVCRDKYPCPPR